MINDKAFFAVSLLLFLLTSAAVGNYVFNERIGLPGVPAADRAVCSDSDGGIDLNVKGVIDGPKLTTGAAPVDYCLKNPEGGDEVVEYSCDRGPGLFSGVVSHLYSGSFKCQYGCADGACLSIPK